MEEEEIIKKLGWKRVSSLWKCILNQRRLRLQEFGVKFNAAEMSAAAQARVDRAADLKARRKKNIFKK